MRARSAIVVVRFVVAGLVAGLVASLVGACAARDPRPRAMRDPEASAMGGWIEIAGRDGGRLEGELLAVSDEGTLYVLTGERDAGRGWVAKKLVTVEPQFVWEARVTGYEATFWSGGVYLAALFTVYTVIGPLLWALAVESADHDLDKHRLVEVTAERLKRLRVWARFPQGPPPGLAVRRAAR